MTDVIMTVPERMEKVQNHLILYVNGRRVLDHFPDPSMTLLRYLRRILYLTGTKEGCSEGGCGACTVMVSKFDPKTEKIRHLTVNACLTLAVSLHGSAVTTVEGIGSLKNGLHPVQERLAKAHGSQCGFCTPGFVMAMYTLLRNSPEPTLEEIEEHLSGNLCRCTGYRPIIEGFRTFCPQSSTNKQEDCPNKFCCKNEDNNGDDFRCTDILFDPKDFKPYDSTQDVIFPPELRINPLDQEDLEFVGPKNSYVRPVTFKKLLWYKKHQPGATIIAGNTELGVQAKYSNQDIPSYIDIKQVNEMCEIKESQSNLEIGAGATISQIEEWLMDATVRLPEKIGVLDELLSTLRRFGSKQIRNMATAGGSIMNGSPFSDLVPLLMVANCSLKFKMEEKERNIPISEFYIGYKKTQSDAEEVLTSINIPFPQKDEYVKSYKQSRRREYDLAIVNAAFLVRFQDSNIVSEMRIAYGGIAQTTIMPRRTIKELEGREWDSGLLEFATSNLLQELDLDLGVPGGMVDYRKTLMISLFFKFFQYVGHKLRVKNPVLFASLTEDEISSTKEMDADLPRSMQFFQKVPPDQEVIDPIGRPIPLVSCLQQTTGEAEYVDDIPYYENELHAAYVTSERPKSKIISIDSSKALQVNGVRGFYSAKDFLDPKEGEVFGVNEVQCVGQIIGLVVANNPEAAHQASSKINVIYEDLPNPVITLKDATKHPFHFSQTSLKRGNVDEGFAQAHHTLEGEFHVGGQEHFYLEPQVNLVIPKSEEELEIYCSCHGLKTLQEKISKVFGILQHKIVCKIKRMGGSFGGKERTAMLVLPLVLAAKRTGRPIRAVLDRRKDMLMTGGRHPMLANWTVGFLDTGEITALKMHIYLNAGWNSDFSKTVLIVAIDKIDGPYRLVNCDILGFCCKTNLPSNTAFRGFGGPQSTLIIDDILSRIAHCLGLNEKEVKEVNLNGLRDVNFPEAKARKYLPLVRCWSEVVEKSNYEARAKEIDDFNRKLTYKKRGIGVVPVMFSSGFEAVYLNQAGALVLVYDDGSVLLSHGGVEMGQGLHTKMIQVASRELQIPMEIIHISDTSTDKVPNSSPTAATASTHLYGMAVLNACQKISKRLAVYKERNPEASWKTWVKDAYMDRTSLSATGFFITPGLTDKNEEFMQGNNRFPYFIFGAAVSEVEIDCLTGDHKVLRTDIVMDVGKSLNPAIDVGQIEGGFVQGMGLYTMEELVYSAEGELLTRGPAMYKIPSLTDIPKVFNVYLLRDSPNPKAIYSSKEIGEPPLLLAASVFSAIRQAVISYRASFSHKPEEDFTFESPATVERIRMSCTDRITQKVKESKLKEDEGRTAAPCTGEITAG